MMLMQERGRGAGAVRTDSRLGHCLLSLQVLPRSVWVFSGYSGPEDIHERCTGMATLSPSK